MPRVPSPPLSGSALLIGLSIYGVCLLLGFGFGWVAGARSGRSIEVAQTDNTQPSDAPKPADPSPADRGTAKEKPTAEPNPTPAPKKDLAKKEPPKPESPKQEPPRVAAPKPPEPKKEPPRTELAVTTNVTFAKDIVPVFRSHCLTCHGIPKIEGGLDVRTLAAILKGGENGEVIKPGDPANSILWIQIQEGAMPPAGKPRMTDAEKKLVKDWIAGGAK